MIWVISPGASVLWDTGILVPSRAPLRAGAKEHRPAVVLEEGVSEATQTNYLSIPSTSEASFSESLDGLLGEPLPSWLAVPCSRDVPSLRPAP